MANWPPRRGGERESDRRMRQVKEMVRLGVALRAEQGLDTIYAQVTQAISSAIGFRVAALNIVRNDSDFVEIAATAGLTEDNRRALLERPPRLRSLIAGMRPEFRRSRSYFIPHQYQHALDLAGGVTQESQAAPMTGPDAWHAEDVLLTPLVSPRTGRLLGILSLDDPEDGRIPSVETIEIIELFANQAAVAIDTSRLFAEREHERAALSEGLRQLAYYLELARQRDLRYTIPRMHTAFDPLVSAINDALGSFNDMLADTRAASEMVNQHASEARAAANYLAEVAADQTDHIVEVSQTVDGMSQNVRQIADTAQHSSLVAQEASEVSREGSHAAELAITGMAQVRELTLQTTKAVKRLGESAQEINDIVQLVADLAANTNLLALNASIEAARAGERGRGFAVVAQEIRSLANRATEATRQINTRIQGVQSGAQQVVTQIEHSIQQVVLQSDLVAQAGAALEAVDMRTRGLAESVQQINDIATEQARVAAQVTETIKALAAFSTQSNASMEQARDSMDYLVELADALQRQVSVFRLREDLLMTGIVDPPPSGTLTMPHLTPMSGPLAPQSAPLMGELRLPPDLAQRMTPSGNLGGNLNSISGVRAAPSGQMTSVPWPSVLGSAIDPSAMTTQPALSVRPSGTLEQMTGRGPRLTAGPATSATTGMHDTARPPSGGGGEARSQLPDTLQAPIIQRAPHTRPLTDESPADLPGDDTH